MREPNMAIYLIHMRWTDSFDPNNERRFSLLSELNDTHQIFYICRLYFLLHDIFSIYIPRYDIPECHSSHGRIDIYHPIQIVIYPIIMK